MRIEYRKRTEMIIEDKPAQAVDIDIAVEVNPEDINPFEGIAVAHDCEAPSEVNPMNPMARIALRTLEETLKLVAKKGE